MLVAILHLDSLAHVNHIITPTMQAILVFEDDILEIEDVSMDLKARLKPRGDARENWKRRKTIRVSRVQRVKAYKIAKELQQDPDSDVLWLDALPADLHLEGFGRVFPRGTTLFPRKDYAVKAQPGYTLKMRYGALKRTVVIRGPQRPRDSPFFLRFEVQHDGWILVNGRKIFRVFSRCLVG